MAKRFGRNQRRKLREANAALEKQVERCESEIDVLSARVRYLNSVERSVTMSRELEERVYYATREIAEMMGKRLGDELYAPAKQLLDSQRQYSTPRFTFDAPIDAEMRTIEIRASIPALQCAVRIPCY